MLRTPIVFRATFFIRLWDCHTTLRTNDLCAKSPSLKIVQLTRSEPFCRKQSLTHVRRTRHRRPRMKEGRAVTDQLMAWLSLYGVPALFGILVVTCAGVPFPD